MQRRYLVGDSIWRRSALLELRMEPFPRKVLLRIYPLLVRWHWPNEDICAPWLPPPVSRPRKPMVLPRHHCFLRMPRPRCVNHSCLPLPAHLRCLGKEEHPLRSLPARPADHISFRCRHQRNNFPLEPLLGPTAPSPRAGYTIRCWMLVAFSLAS